MKQRLHLFVTALFVLSLGWNLWIWGGIARHRELGPVIDKAARNEVSLGSLYLHSGAALLDVSGLAPQAAASAEASFGPALDSVRRSPVVAMENLQLDQPALVRASYYGAPLLLLATLLAWWFRPREVHLSRRR